MPIEAKNTAKNRRVDAARPSSVIPVPPCGPATAGSPCCLSAEKSRARFFAPLRCAQNDRFRALNETGNWKLETRAQNDRLQRVK
jgi:hypothetical protein